MFPTSTNDSMRLPTHDRAFNAIFIGRTFQISLFESYLDKWKTRISTVPSVATRQQEATPGKDNKIQGLVALLYGRGGFGKSTLLKHYHDIATQPGRNLFVSNTIDWQAVVTDNRDMFNPPPGQAIDAEAYFMVLRHQLAEKLGKSADKFKEFNKAIGAIQNARKQISGELDNARKDPRYEWLIKAGSQEIVALVRAAFPVVNVVPGIDTVAGAAEQGLELGAKYGIDQVDQLSKRLRDKLRHETALDYLTPEVKLGVGLGRDLAQFAKDWPLLIFIDTYELADEGDQFLRIVMGAAGARLGWVIAGRDNLWGGEDFHMRSPKTVIGYEEIVDFGFAIDFNAGGVGAFSVEDIIEYFSLLAKNASELPHRNVPNLAATITKEEAARILDVTEGVPLAVQIAAGIYLQTGDLNTVTQKDGREPEIVHRMVDRYLQHVPENDRAKIYGLALLRRSDPHQADAIAAALGLTEEQGNKSNYDDELRRLHRRYSFIFTEKTQSLLHKEVRDFLRQSLLERRNDREIKKINQSIWNAHKASLTLLEERRQYTDLRERLEETEWVGVYLDLVEQQFWLEPADGVNYCLPFMLAEAIYGRDANQERPYANPEAVAVGNFFLSELQSPYNNRWKWAASSLAYLQSDNPLPEALRGLEELEKVISQHCPTFPLPEPPDYRPTLMAALWWRLGEAYAGSDFNKSWTWYKKALEKLDDEKDLRVAAAWIAWNIGFKLFNDEKKYEESLPFIDRSLELNPNFIYSYNGRGVVYKNLKHYDQAIRDYNKVIEMDSDYASAYNNRGNVFYIRKLYDTAIQDYTEAIKHDATFVIAYNNRGRAYFARKDYDLALLDYNKALELDPANVDAYNNRGNLYYARKDYDQALREYNKALEVDPKNVNAYNNRGLVYFVRKDYGQAIQNFNKALELDPKYAYAYNNRGNLYADRKDYDQALREYSKALEVDPENVDAHNNRGLVYAARKDSDYSDQALREYNEALELDPANVDAYNNRGSLYYARKDYHQALREYSKAIELDPRYIDAYNNRGLVYADRKDYDRALLDYNKAIELDPSYVNAYINRGSLYADRKAYDPALREYNKALEVDPENVDAYNKRGNLSYDRKDYDRALLDYNKAIELDPGYAYAYNNRGLIYAARKDYHQALREYSKAIELDPRYVDAYNNRGNLYYARKDYDQALLDYNKAIELDPKFAPAYSNRGLISLLKGDSEQAITNYKRAKELDPNDINAGWMAEWVGMGKKREGIELATRLERNAENNPQHYAGLVCLGVAQGLRGNLHEELVKLDEAISLEQAEPDAYFWKGMTYAYQKLSTVKDASEAFEQALTNDLPPLLLTPLYWLERDRPDFFRVYARPLLDKFGL